jgi:putative ABC transport system substrate-binding protein
MLAPRRVLLTGGMALLVAHRLGHGQPAATMRLVGYLSASTTAIGGHLRDALKQGMRDFGWIEGSNLEYRIAYSDTGGARFDALAVDLIGQQVDVIVAPSAPAALAAQKATKTIPIVFASVPDPVGLGLVASLARPGGNITGMATQAADVLSKRIEILHQAVPTARRIAILLNENMPTPEVFWAVAEAACASLGLVALRVAANTPAQFGVAAEQIVSQRAQAVVVVSNLLYYLERERLQEQMQITRLPVTYEFREYLGSSGLLSYGVDMAATFRYLAKWVDKILKGAKPADLPVERPTQFALVVNLKAAKALGLTIPQAVLLRADEVIQ